MMYALTLHQPYAWAIPRFKDVENRKWPPPDSLLVGQQIAIHAAKRYVYDEEAAVLQEWRKHYMLPPIIHLKRDMPRGAVVAVARIIGWCEVDSRVRIVRVGRSFDRERYVMRRIAKSRHATGPFCWLLDERRELPKPIPCRGYQRLWKLPPDAERRVREQLP